MRSGDWPAACHIGRSAALPANHHCAVGLLPLLRKEFRLLKLILHSELRRRAASRRALPCRSSFILVLSWCYLSCADGFTQQVLQVYTTETVGVSHDECDARAAVMFSVVRASWWELTEACLD